MKDSMNNRGSERWRVIRLMAVVSILGVHQVGAVPTYNPVTAHWYDIVSSGSDGSWANAEANAIALGGHLVTINNAAAEAWLRATCGTATRFWIGFNDAAQEGTWVWASGETPGYTHWASGEPNNCTPPDVGEDYAVLNWDTANGAWNDFHHLRPDYFHNIDGIAEWISAPEAGSTLTILGLSCLVLRVLRYRWA